MDQLARYLARVRRRADWLRRQGAFLSCADWLKAEADSIACELDQEAQSGVAVVEYVFPPDGDDPYAAGCYEVVTRPCPRLTPFACRAVGWVLALRNVAFTTVWDAIYVLTGLKSRAMREWEREMAEHADAQLLAYAR